MVTANKNCWPNTVTKSLPGAQEKGVTGGSRRGRRYPHHQTLREGPSANHRMTAGIINGTSNFILTEMRDKGLAFCRRAGRSSNAQATPKPTRPTSEGHDAAHKLTIMAAAGHGIPMQFDKAYLEGISKLTARDIRYAEEPGHRIKLLGITRRTDKGVELRVHPTPDPGKAPDRHVDGVMNAVMVGRRRRGRHHVLRRRRWQPAHRFRRGGRLLTSPAWPPPTRNTACRTWPSSRTAWLT